MNLKRAIHALTPPALAWRLGKTARTKKEIECFGKFYRQFLSPGELCFDIGANLGNRTRCFAYLGCKVVAVEPQPKCFNILVKEFGGNPNIELVNAAVGKISGTGKLHLSADHVLSTLSQSFMEETTRSGRFSSIRWNKVEDVAMTTLDQLIAGHGEPRFIKIDVEGYESEVISGLTRPVPALSIEWVPELPENARICLHHLMELGDYEFNISWGESMKFSRPQWRSARSILAVIEELEGDTELFGDIYAKLKSS